MEKLFWKDEYSVGVEKFDRQHRHLFEIINKLIERSAASSDSKLVTEILTEMLKYAKEHFTDEEELMQEYGYPEIELHKKQHAYFIETTAELSINALNNQSMVSREIAEFLRLWWMTHILKIDMKYKEFFKAKIPAGVC
ncbi:MAG: bacteriohemerythrin [Sedimentisphaerales bacterium]|nr:bacteriohemerythrin [Sedimentisphaerales bacterium]